MISDILSDNVARTPLWGSNSLVHFPNRDVAVKSGSTNNLRDAWVFGYTPDIAVGTWVGNNDNTPMGGGLSGLITTPMWREFLDVALSDTEVHNFAQPQINTSNIKPILRGDYIDSTLVAEQRASNGTSTLDLQMISSNVHNILHFVDKNNPNGPYPSNPRNDPQYENWEYSVQQWRRKTFPPITTFNFTTSEAETDTQDE
jgi:penicillin-binding protein 1A